LVEGRQPIAVGARGTGKEILEYPIEKKIYETDGWIGDPHISLDGQQIAFVQHPLPGDDMGAITVMDLSGKQER